MSRNDLDGSLALLRLASKLSSSADVTAAVSGASAEWASSAASAAESLRQSHRYAEALSLLSSAAEYDPALKSRVVAVQGEFEKFKAAEHDRLVSEAEAALSSKRWADAAERFQAAQQMKPDALAAAAERFARAMAAGDAAVSKGEWRAAEQSYRAAVDSGQDHGDAARAIDAVAVRIYTIRVASILVKPQRPDGEPWVGRPNASFLRVVAAAAALSGAGVIVSSIASKVADVVENIPPENQPRLVLELTLPDGRAFMTEPPHRGLYWNPGTQVSVATNAYDNRPLILRVSHRVPNRTDASVGTVQVPLKRLVSERRVPLEDASIAQLELLADQSSRSIDGATSQDLAPVPDATNTAPTVSKPAPDTQGFKLTRVEALVVPGEAKSVGPPDLCVELVQDGRVVFRSPVTRGAYKTAWAPERTFLFVRSGEGITVRVVEKRLLGDDLALQYAFTDVNASSGQVEATTPAGSYARLSFEQRRSEP
jgi:tetratricopeptide (TPR) repeat protein